jgi:hypothetical protein
MPRGSGRRLTYRERWESLREWARWYAELEHQPIPRAWGQEILLKMAKLDHTTLVKARPVRPKARRLTRKGRMAHAGNR